MSNPRRWLPGQTHAISRRVAGRRFLLKPTSFVNEVLLYALARAKQLNPKVSVHGFVAESNHTHANVTDTRKNTDVASQLSSFFASLNRLTAAALNTHYGRGENLWAVGPFSNVEVHGRRSIEQQLLYLWTNPVKDGLVERPEDWPGICFMPEDFGRRIQVVKPDGAFFGGRRGGGATEPDAHDSWQAELAREEAEARALLKNGPPARKRERVRTTLPEVIELKIDPPPGYQHMPIEQVRAHFRALLDAELQRIYLARRAAGVASFMGAQAVLCQSPFDSAGGTWPSFKTSPRIACRGDNQRRIALLVGLSEWRASYRLAYEALEKKVSMWFPAGTHKVARLPGVRVRQATGPPIAA